MTREEFKKIVEEIKANKWDLCVAVTIPGQDDVEYIINKYKSIDNKLQYYLKTYDENMTHCMNDRIKIIKAFGVDFYVGN